MLYFTFDLFLNSRNACVAGLVPRGDRHKVAKPCFVEQDLPTSSLPQRTNVFRFAPGMKCLMPGGEHNKLLQMFGLRVLRSRLPFAHGPARHTQVIGQRRLGQSDSSPQGQHHLPERIVSVSVGVMLHNLPSYMNPGQSRWERSGVDIACGRRIRSQTGLILTIILPDMHFAVLSGNRAQR